MEHKLKPLRPFMNPLIPIYHGSPFPNISKFQITPDARSRTDFGLGVYFTTSREQAKKWSVRGEGVTHGYVYETYLDYRRILNGEIKLKEFLDYTDDFIDAFTYCRAYGKNPNTIQGYDIIYGLMIDSNGTQIYNTCDDYAAGKISKIEVKNKLKALDMSDQLCIKSQDILNKLEIINVYETYVLPGRVKSDERNIIWKK